MNIPRWLTFCGLLWATLSPALATENPDPAGLDFFEKKIRPVLIAHCYKCHSAEAKSVKGGLLLDTREGLLTGGDTGPAILPGKPEESLLIGSLRYADDAYEMPPAGKLPAEVIADFEKWVALGAPDPRVAAAPPSAREAIDIDAGRKFWSFQKPRPHAPPVVKRADWARQPLDAFILAKLEAAGLSPAPRADRATLLRRVYFDLIGLPPTPDEALDFLADEDPLAFEKVVERLLASPHYGERWGRHWLDVVRYAEDNTNMGPHNGPYEHAWRYRDWVVQALNDDMPYDQFIKRQLATDLMPETGIEDLPALGLMGLGPANHKELLMEKIEIDRCFADDWEDRVDALGRGLLGLTLACARCHDHKFDPITTRDYYALAGVFASSRQTPRPLIPQLLLDASEPAREQVAEWEKQVAELDKQIKEQAKAVQAEMKAAAPPAEAKNPAAATAKVGDGEAVGAPGESGQPESTSAAKLAELQAQVAELKARIEATKSQTPHFVVPMANALTEETTLVEKVDEQSNRLAYYAQPRDLPLYVRGDVAKPGPIVPRRFVAVLTAGEPRPFTQGSGRLELAEAIVSPENPLTARVIVNRVWRQRFGGGLVGTPSNFGTEGERPTHPELLDDLAVGFMAEGWSLKKLHRRMILSATYQQASRVSPAHLAADPENRLLSRFASRRLEIEPYRDAILAASGQLDRTLGGASQPLSSPDFRRRTLYASVSRHKMDDVLASFDFPDPNIHAERRSVTTTPLQQLFVLNSVFLQTQGALLAERIANEAGPALERRVRLAHLLLFAREPTADEQRLAEQFVQGGDAERQLERWRRYSQALLGGNELLHID